MSQQNIENHTVENALCRQRNDGRWELLVGNTDNHCVHIYGHPGNIETALPTLHGHYHLGKLIAPSLDMPCFEPAREAWS